MKQTRYKTFSLRTHKKNWLLKKPNLCQFELTFGCNLHCKHCYTDCYNNPACLKKELKTKEVKFILDKVHDAGAIWLCLTGGDPLTRGDFPDIYSHAKGKGFIITVFTNGYSMTEEIAGYFKKRPPFVIEITLNAVTGDLYEKISRVKGSFNKAMNGINLMLKEGLPLKIKTEVTRDNLGEVPGIKKFIKGLGLKFRPSADLHARLNGDLTPCNLRISPHEVLNLNGRKHLPDDDCQLLPHATRNARHASRVTLHDDLFRCAIGSGDGFHIDPYGNTSPCNLIRKPAFNLLKADVENTLNELLSWVRNRKFATDSKCNGCNLRKLCQSCPGRAYLETGDMEAPVEDYCEMARAILLGKNDLRSFSFPPDV